MCDLGGANMPGIFCDFMSGPTCRPLYSLVVTLNNKQLYYGNGYLVQECDTFIGFMIFKLYINSHIYMCVYIKLSSGKMGSNVTESFK